MFYPFILLLFYISNILSHSIIKKQLEDTLNQANNIRQLQSTITLSCNSGDTYPTQDQLTTHTAQAITLTCMDFRLVDDSACLLNIQGYNNNYDAFILAGASLGYNIYADWATIFNKHVGLAEALHDIHKVIVVDHAKCGAYRLMYPNINWSTISVVEEYQHHVSQIENFAAAMKYYYPNVTIEAYYLYINGTATNVPIQGTGQYPPSSNNNSNNGSISLGSGDIAAIVLGGVLFIILVGGVAIWLTKSRKYSYSKPQGPNSPSESVRENNQISQANPQKFFRTKQSQFWIVNSQ